MASFKLLTASYLKSVIGILMYTFMKEEKRL